MGYVSSVPGGYDDLLRLRPFFFWCRNAAGWSQVDEDELEMGERELYEVQFWQVPMAIPALQRVTSRQVAVMGFLLCSTRTRRAQRIGWPVLPQHSKVKAGWWMDLKVDVNNLWLHIQILWKNDGSSASCSMCLTSPSSGRFELTVV